MTLWTQFHSLSPVRWHCAGHSLCQGFSSLITWGKIYSQQSWRQKLHKQADFFTPVCDREWLNTSLFQLVSPTVLMGGAFWLCLDSRCTGVPRWKHTNVDCTQNNCKTHWNVHPDMHTHTVADTPHTHTTQRRRVQMQFDVHRGGDIRICKKRLCRRPEIFNDESIHYRIRSLCFCCHEMYTFIISHPRIWVHCPRTLNVLGQNVYKIKKKEEEKKQTGIPVWTSVSTRTTKCLPVFLNHGYLHNDALCVVQLFRIRNRD